MFNKNKNIIKQSEELAKELNYNGDINYNSTLLALYIGCIIVIYNSFCYFSNGEKKGIWPSIKYWSYKKQIKKSVFYEALVVGVIGIILGILGAYIGIGTVILIINNLISDMLEYKLYLVTNYLFIIIPVIFMIIVIGVSALSLLEEQVRFLQLKLLDRMMILKLIKRKLEQVSLF